jgi:hypothetical protein
LVRRKLATSYPLLTIWLIFGAVRSAYLLYVLVYDRRAYGAMTAMFSTWNIAGWVLITIECFISMAKHLKGAYQLAGAVILFGCLGATLCHVTENFAPWPYIYTWMLELYRHAALCCLTVVVLSRWFMTQWRPPKNALRYCDALIVFFAGEMLAYWIFRSSLGRYWIVAAGQILLQSGVLLALMVWHTMRTEWQALPGDEAVQGRETLPELRSTIFGGIKSVLRWYR